MNDSRESTGLVVILQGISGSGKSTRAAQLGGTVVSADAYFTEADGLYNFKPALLADAHGHCLRSFVDAVLARHALIVVDNTNTTVAEVAPYYSIAVAYGYRVEIHRLWAQLETATDRGLRGVQLRQNAAMLARLERFTIPPFWSVTLTTVQTDGVQP